MKVDKVGKIVLYGIAIFIGIGIFKRVFPQPEVQQFGESIAVAATII